MTRRIWIFSLVILLAACGGQPEQIVPPTPVEPTTIATPLPPEPPVTRIEPTTVPRREAAPPPGEALQVVAAGRAGSVDASNVIPGNLYALEASTISLQRLTVNATAADDPAWSPNGTQVYFTVEEDSTPYIYTLTATNTNPIQRLSAFPSGEQRQPTISADGLFVAFTSARGGADAIYRMSAIDGRGVEQITFNPTRDYEPDWSPDNTWIVFTSERDGNAEIYIMDTTGGRVQRLTDHPANDSQPAFSPDGRQVVFVSDRSGRPQLYTMGLPVPQADPNEPSEGAAIDIANGIPPLLLDASAPPPPVLPITTDASPKSHPDWYRGRFGGFGLVYAAELPGPDGPYSQLFQANNDGSGITPLTPLFISLSAPAVRPGTPAQTDPPTPPGE